MAVMAKIKESFIKCGNCGTKFRSPFFIGDTKTFSHAVLWGNRVKCPFCELTIDAKKENMSYVLEDEPGGPGGDESPGHRSGTDQVETPHPQ